MSEQGCGARGRRRSVAIALLIGSLGCAITGFGMAGLEHGGEAALMAKRAWAHAHVLMALIFIVSATWHTILNRRSILGYMGIGRASGSDGKGHA